MRFRLLFACSPLMLVGCGYVGDTRPPSLRLPSPVRDLAAVERGDKIIVQFTAPTHTTEDLPLREMPRLVVYIAEKPFEIKKADDLLVRAEIPAAQFYGRDVNVYVRALNGKERDAGISNEVRLHVLTALEAPANLHAEAIDAGVQVSWDSPSHQFTIFRQGPSDKGLVKLDTTEHSPYVDRTAEYGKGYRYAVQAQSGDTQSEVAEMAKAYIPVDKFPPSIPKSLAAVVGTQSVELVWDPDTEPDLAGYRIYRDAGSGQFERIGESHDRPGFSDKNVEKGKRYRYAVTAYDKEGNESLISEAVEALIP